MAAGVHSPLRIAAGLGLFGLAPGVALLPRAPDRPAPVEVGLVVAFSLAVCTVGAQLMLWLGAWSPPVATWALAAGCLLVLLLRRAMAWATR
jgi:hypothetical protein